MNFLEQLAAEWFEFQGYFVRRNVLVSRRDKGGYEGELDVVAFNPSERRLVHIEASMDAGSWETREKRFTRKFELGRQHIPNIFKGFDIQAEPEQMALLVFASTKNKQKIGGGKIVLIADFMEEIRNELAKRPPASEAVPEQFVVLRTLQFAHHYRKR